MLGGGKGWGGGNPLSLKMLFLRYKEVNCFYSLSFCNPALHPYTRLLSFWFFLFQPAGSSGSAVATPPPLVRGPQSVAAGKPSLQVSGGARLPGIGHGAEDEVHRTVPSREWLGASFELPKPHSKLSKNDWGGR